MSWNTPDDYEAPPPAYEEDFDRKVSLAVETSLVPQETAPAEGDDEWETWDEATYQANASAETQNGNASSSSRPTPADRPTSHLPASKQRPSWYDQAGLGPTTQTNSGSANGAAASSHPLPPPPSSNSFTSPSPALHSFSPEPEDHDEPLPPFTAVDGVPQDHVTVLSWNVGSRPPSPLVSPPTPTVGLPNARSPVPGMTNGSSRRSLPPPPPLPNTTRQSIPPPPKLSPQRMGPRPVLTGARPREGIRVALPHVQFDPSTAYNNADGNNLGSGARNSMLPAPKMNHKASSFYNSSVTATLGRPNGSSLPQPSKHLPQRITQSGFQPHLNSAPYDTSGYHSPKPIRAYPTANIPSSPPPVPATTTAQYSQYLSQGGWQMQPHGGSYPNYYGQ